MMQLYNTQTQKKEELNIKKPIGIYVCGITPYDTTHLGHAFTFIVYDVLVRYLRFQKANVIYVQNVTDVDDDILIRAKSMGTTWKRLGKRETKKHLKNMDGLNALRPDYFPYASQNIKEMIEIIKVLIEEGFAYEKNGSVYFSVKKYKKFGQLSKLNYWGMLQIANERGNFPLDPNKKDPLDFVLWQAQKPQEPAWYSPWGRGRPGWHIECSGMSLKLLGPTITIHGGGEDLIFPHHDAEIAQSENYTGKKYVKYWMHAAMVYCEDKKMSKSLGNMIFVHDLLKKYDANTIRIFLLLHHYRKAWNFEEEDLEKAKEISKLLTTIAKKPTLLKEKPTELKKHIPGFLKALDDDLNTPLAINYLLKQVKTQKTELLESIYLAGQILGLKFEDEK